MKSKNPPKGTGGTNYGDPEQDLTPQQLAKIGAIAIEFNYAEYALERALSDLLNLPGNLWVDTIKRLGSIDHKIELSKISVSYFDRILTRGYKLTELSFVKGWRVAFGSEKEPWAYS